MTLGSRLGVLMPVYGSGHCECGDFCTDARGKGLEESSTVTSGPGKLLSGERLQQHLQLAQGKAGGSLVAIHK